MRLAAGLLCAVAPLAGCRRAPVNPWVSVPSARFAGRAFGDTVTMRASIVALDTLRDVVVFTLSAPAHLVVLDVTPGVSIDQLHPGVGTTSRRQDAGEHMVAVADSVMSTDEAALLATQAFDQCIDRAEIAARRRPANRPQVVRDSTGKPTPASVEAQRRFDEAQLKPSSGEIAACRRQADAQKARPARRAVRTGEHYLVVLAAQSSISGVDVAERLRTLSVVGSDVATTIEAIGAGLFVGRPGSWAGYYVSR